MNTKYLKRILFFTFGIAILASLYSPSAQAQSKAWTKITTPDRFSEVFTDAILDKETNLIWEKTPHGVAAGDTGSFELAQFDCRLHSTGGVRGWRLPTVDELGTLLSSSATAGLYLPAGHPFLGIPGGQVIHVFWTSTTAELSFNQNPGPEGWGIDFSNLGLIGTFAKTQTNYIWCVRGGSN